MLSLLFVLGAAIEGTAYTHVGAWVSQGAQAPTNELMALFSRKYCTTCVFFFFLVEHAGRAFQHLHQRP